MADSDWPEIEAPVAVVMPPFATRVVAPAGVFMPVVVGATWPATEPTVKPELFVNWKAPPDCPAMVLTRLERFVRVTLPPAVAASALVAMKPPVCVMLPPVATNSSVPLEPLMEALILISVEADNDRMFAVLQETELATVMEPPGAVPVWISTLALASSELMVAASTSESTPDVNTTGLVPVGVIGALPVLSMVMVYGSRRRVPVLPCAANRSTLPRKSR